MDELKAIMNQGANPLAEKLASTALYPPFDLSPTAEKAENMNLK